jgi:hypothetical protein
VHRNEYAAVYARVCTAANTPRMDELRDGFLARDNMATLEWQAADPITLGRLVFSRYTRIDVLRRLLDEQLSAVPRLPPFAGLARRL